jgi:hypothetical protein
VQAPGYSPAAGQRHRQRRARQQGGQRHAAGDDDDHGQQAQQRPGDHRAEMILPAQPQQYGDDQHVGEVDAVGVVRAGPDDGPGEPGPARSHQGHAREVAAGDRADVERDKARLEGGAARAERAGHPVVGQEVDDRPAQVRYPDRQEPAPVEAAEPGGDRGGAGAGRRLANPAAGSGGDTGATVRSGKVLLRANGGATW